MLLVPCTASAAEESAAPAQVLTGQASHSVLPAEPASLGWETPGGALWARGEASLGAAEPEAEAGFGRGALALGARQELALLPNLSWSVAPQLLLESAADPQGLPGTPALNGALQQDLALSLPGEAKLVASIGLGDRLGMAGLASPAGVLAGASLRSRVSLAVQAAVSGAPLQMEIQLTATRPVAAEHGPARANGCELAVMLRWGGTAPLRLAGSCPGDALRRVTLGLSTSF
ncbi:hypothetical protein E2C06_35045 [Dankookia rubra]|uniref:Uncharacterized protein n=1 Tax=Dankookia rubra TaxID=1442381 RepID=A0A4R5Q5Z4_9PROT|nr:hypothetical protein [Dankookia rubra]TDH57973.1 hypothetical protein E2C06_35045 [Dankookia rubra]